MAASCKHTKQKIYLHVPLIEKTLHVAVQLQEFLSGYSNSGGQWHLFFCEG